MGSTLKLDDLQSDEGGNRGESTVATGARKPSRFGVGMRRAYPQIPGLERCRRSARDVRSANREKSWATLITRIVGHIHYTNYVQL